jgi:DNA-binding GntR family transcriptional regulator
MAAQGPARSAASLLAPASPEDELTPRLRSIAPSASASLKAQAYAALKRAIVDLDLDGREDALRLDERRLSAELGISRTPVREALTMLTLEGFVRQVPRRGLFVVRHSRREIVDMIVGWAALESMAARLAAARVTAEDIAELRAILADFLEAPQDEAGMRAYSEANIRFHQAIVRLGGNATIEDLTGNLFLHMRAIRSLSLRQENRAGISVRDHADIIAALEARDAPRAEALVRDHALGLAAHVARHGNFPD